MPAPSVGWARLGRFRFSPDSLLRIALIASALVYVQAITYGFVYDDLIQIEMNPWIQSWKFWRLFFTTNVWSFLRAHAQGSYYRPVFLLWVTANHTAFGSTPGWWHLTSVGAHVCATALVYVFAVRLLHDRWTGGLAALLFAVYPLHIEAVSWVSGIPEVLVTVFFVAALLCYQNWKERGRVLWLAVSTALYALALLSKETALAFLPVVGVFAWSNQHARNRFRSTAVCLAPFIGVTIVYFAARANAIGGMAGSNFPRPFSWVALTWPAAMWFYLRQLCWPFGLSILYDFDLVHAFSVQAVLLPLVLSAVVVSAVIWFGRKVGFAALAVSWLLTPLVPALAGIKVFQWHDYVHDRYLYLPSVMAAVLLAAAVRQIAEVGNRRRLALAIAVCLIGVFSVATILQNPRWATEETLFAHAHKRAPDNPLASDYRARVLYGQGRTEEAFAAMEELVREHPDYWQANVILGFAYYQKGRYADAEKYLTVATQIWSREFIRPDATQFYYLGLTQQRRSATAEAEKSFRRAIELRPDAPGYRMALAQILKQRGDTAGANEQLRLEAENRKAYEARQQGIGVGD